MLRLRDASRRTTDALKRRPAVRPWDSLEAVYRTIKTDGAMMRVSVEEVLAEVHDRKVAMVR